MFGDGITPVALTFAVLDLTGSGTDLGLVLAAQALPLAGLALVGGVWADRLPRAEGDDRQRPRARRRAGDGGGAAAERRTRRSGSSPLLAALHGAAEAFFRPAAGALLPQLVPAPDLQKANALMGMSDNFGWMVGPAVAGTLVALVGAGGAIAVDAATFVVSAAFLTGVRVPAVVEDEGRAAASSPSCATAGARCARAPGSG